MPAPWSTARPSRERDAPFRKELDAADSLAFMPRLFVLTTLPHRRPESHRFERVNGWQSLRMVAPRRHATHDLARKLGLSIVSGPRGTAAPSLDRLAARLGLAGASWRTRLLLHEDFFSEITRSAVPVDLRAVHQLKGSPLALDLYSWLTYRMSYLRKPTLVPWRGLRAQLGGDYGRPRDFRRIALARLEDVVTAYPELRIRGEKGGVRLYPSPPHIKSLALKTGATPVRLPDFVRRSSH